MAEKGEDMSEETPGGDALMPEFQRLTEEHPTVRALRELIAMIMEGGTTDEEGIVATLEDVTKVPPHVDEAAFHEMLVKGVRLHLKQLELEAVIKRNRQMDEAMAKLRPYMEGTGMTLGEAMKMIEAGEPPPTKSG